jgi:hypothetical protein
MPHITKQEQRGTTQVASHASGVLHAIASNMLRTALQQAAPSGIRTVGNGDAAGMLARLAQAGVRDRLLPAGASVRRSRRGHPADASIDIGIHKALRMNHIRGLK